MKLPLVEITSKVFVNPFEVASLEEEQIPGGYYDDSHGTTITLRNGRKVLVKNYTAKEVMKRLEGAKCSQNDAQ